MGTKTKCKEIANKKKRKIWMIIRENANGILAVVTTISLIITIIIAVVSISAQINLAKENINFLEKTSSNNWANLEIEIGNFYDIPGTIKILDAEELSIPKREINRGKSVAFRIINSGKINSGTIYNLGDYDDPYISTLIGDGSPLNISSQSGIKGIIYLNQNGCSIDREKNCNSSKIPSGEYNLTLKLNCEFCIPTQRIINVNIPLCIYHNNEEYKYCNNLLNS
jgi:hypothetical protein